MKKTGYCGNKACMEYGPIRLGLCPACRRMGKRGVFVGGIIVGIVWAVVKLCQH